MKPKQDSLNAWSMRRNVRRLRVFRVYNTNNSLVGIGMRWDRR